MICLCWHRKCSTIRIYVKCVNSQSWIVDILWSLFMCCIDILWSLFMCCICWTFLYCAFSSVSSNCLPQRMQSWHSISLWFCPLFCPLLHFPCVLPSNFALALALYFANIFALVLKGKVDGNVEGKTRAKFQGKTLRKWRRGQKYTFYLK